MCHELCQVINIFSLIPQNNHIGVYIIIFKMTTKLKDNKLVINLRFCSYLVKELKFKIRILMTRHFSTFETFSSFEA